MLGNREKRELFKLTDWGISQPELMEELVKTFRDGDLNKRRFNTTKTVLAVMDKTAHRYDNRVSPVPTTRSKFN